MGGDVVEDTSSWENVAGGEKIITVQAHVAELCQAVSKGTLRLVPCNMPSRPAKNALMTPAHQTGSRLGMSTTLQPYLPSVRYYSSCDSCRR